jgi:hypothetical protein
MLMTKPAPTTDAKTVYISPSACVGSVIFRVAAEASTSVMLPDSVANSTRSADTVMRWLAMMLVSAATACLSAHPINESINADTVKFAMI